mmetsp:Transcript_32423/g.92371  ORF Transcript_32423/g.92371 Transcript_32423/m.92371 type:complete len:250 (-) Transcript_32423:54-803(-)
MISTFWLRACAMMVHGALTPTRPFSTAFSRLSSSFSAMTIAKLSGDKPSNCFTLRFNKAFSLDKASLSLSSFVTRSLEKVFSFGVPTLRDAPRLIGAMLSRSLSWACSSSFCLDSSPWAFLRLATSSLPSESIACRARSLADDDCTAPLLDEVNSFFKSTISLDRSSFSLDNEAAISFWSATIASNATLSVRSFAFSTNISRSMLRVSFSSKFCSFRAKFSLASVAEAGSAAAASLSSAAIYEAGGCRH